MYRSIYTTSRSSVERAFQEMKTIDLGRLCRGENEKYNLVRGTPQCVWGKKKTKKHGEVCRIFRVQERDENDIGQEAEHYSYVSIVILRCGVLLGGWLLLQARLGKGKETKHTFKNKRTSNRLSE